MAAGVDQVPGFNEETAIFLAPEDAVLFLVIAVSFKVATSNRYLPCPPGIVSPDWNPVKFGMTQPQRGVTRSRLIVEERPVPRALPRPEMRTTSHWELPAAQASKQRFGPFLGKEENMNDAHKSVMAIDD